MSYAPVHWSTLKAMAESPLAYRTLLDTPREDTPSLLLGRAVHCAILEPARFQRAYCVCERPDGTPIRRDARTQEYRDFLAAHEGAEVLTRSDFDRCIAMSRSVWRDRASLQVLDVAGAWIERSLEWDDPATGIECAGRIDHLHRGFLTDLKTMRGDLSPRAVSSDVARYAYHAQLAWYLDGLRACGFAAESALLLCVQSQSPHDVGVFLVSDEALEAGRTHYRDLMARLAVCREEDRWPGRYDGQRQELALPQWAEGMPDDSEITFNEED